MAGLIAQLRAFGLVRLGIAGGVGLAVLGFLLWLALRASQPAMAVLYADLEARDAAAVVAALERARIPHRLSAGGSRIEVPEAEVPRARLLLARDGLPAGGSVGWELFDRGDSLTTTPFQQDVNRLRALEGELARTIRGLSGVRAARVHLVLPRREPFQRERTEAQASVVLTMAGAQRLDREGVQAVLHLVATAVPGLRPQNISIVDSRGELLARGGQAVGAGAAVASGEELRRAQEARLSRAIEEMLERAVGPGRVRAEAAVEMDFDRVQTTEERFDPDNQVPRSTQSVQESNRSGEPQAVTVANQLPGAAAAQPSAQPQALETRQEETTNFEIGRTVRNVVREQPQIRRISVAVLVDGVREPQPDGRPGFRERTPEELARLAGLVRGAIGFDERRGDRVEVVSMRFADIEAGTEEPGGLAALLLAPGALLRLAETAILALAGLAALLLVGRPMVSRLGATLAPRQALAGAQAAAAALPGAAGAQALPGERGAPQIAGPEQGEAMVSLAMVEGQMRASSIAKVQQLVEKHPEETLLVMRRWLTPEERT